MLQLDFVQHDHSSLTRGANGALVSMQAVAILKLSFMESCNNFGDTSYVNYVCKQYT